MKNYMHLLAAGLAVGLVSGCVAAENDRVRPYVFPDERGYADFLRPNPSQAGVTNEIVTLSNSNGTAKVSLLGAYLFSYVPAGGEEVLFSVAKPDFGSELVQPAGIPVVWPWFARNGEAGSTPHAFARQMKWKVLERAENAWRSRLVLGLESTDETRRLWPYEFRLRYTIVLADQLQVSLETENVDKVPLTITEGFHTYFRVSDVNTVVLRGLDGCCDMSGGCDAKRTWFEGDLAFQAGESRVFAAGMGEYLLFDRGLGRVIAMSARGNSRLILWSKRPGPSPDPRFSGDDWKHLTCLEPAILGREAALTILPGRKHDIRMSVKALPYP